MAHSWSINRVRRGTGRLLRLPVLLALPLCAAGQTADEQGSWRQQLLAGLSAKYGAGPAAGQTEDALLDQLAGLIGRRLAQGGSSGVPASDVAELALLLARRNEMSAAGAAGGTSPAVPHTSARDTRASTQPQAGTLAPGPGVPNGDMQKGQEGLRQGIERLRRLPVSERFVFTGDITSGILAATVPGAADLTSMFGRTRVNVVARAVPGSADGLFSEGHFFLQLQAAGGPFDSRPAGGPGSFSALNDVATRRSRFNEGLSRGNLYLGKTFYQQELRLGHDRVAGRIGIVDLTDFFDTNSYANNESRQFLNSALANSAGYKAGITAPGLMGEYRRKTNRDWLEGAVLRVGYAVSRTERAFTSPLWTSEIELNTLLGGYRGNWRLGGTLGNIADAGGIRGIHFSADHTVSRRAGIFGRYAYGGSGKGSLALSPVRQSYSGGVQWRFTDRQDHVSSLGIGFSQAFPIDPGGILASERILETFYRWQITENLSLTPDFQIVLGSAGKKSSGTHTVLGLRMFFGL